MKNNLDDASSYFNIGFRASNSIEELKKYKEGLDCNINAIQDAYSIIENCQKALNKKVSVIDTNVRIYHRLVLGNIEELMKMKKEDIIQRNEEVETSEKTLKSIINKEPVSKEDLECTINLFDRISDKCLDYNRPGQLF